MRTVLPESEKLYLSMEKELEKKQKEFEKQLFEKVKEEIVKIIPVLCEDKNGNVEADVIETADDLMSQIQVGDIDYSGLISSLISFQKRKWRKNNKTKETHDKYGRKTPSKDTIDIPNKITLCRHAGGDFEEVVKDSYGVNCIAHKGGSGLCEIDGKKCSTFRFYQVAGE